VSTPLVEAVDAELNRRQIEEDRERLPQSLYEFVKASWNEVEPLVPFVDNWHLTAICEHLEACSRREIERLQIWVPRASMKSRLVSCFWHAWEWTHSPWVRVFSVSYDLRLSGRLASDTRDLMMRPWYQDRWGHMFEFTREGERYYGNSHGGTRLATATKGGALGEHGNRILIDDPINVRQAEANSGLLLQEANDWYDSVVPGTRLNPCAEVIIMQRLHENDLAGHALAGEYHDWTVLCLPERFEVSHPYAWRKPRLDENVVKHLPDELKDGDPRQEGELLWPARRDERASNAMAAGLTSFRAAGQMQQRPASREGEILKTDWWRFYDPRIRDKDDWDKLPRFTSVVVSVDTPLKDKESSDNVAIQCWGVRGADRYLLDLRLDKMNYPTAKRQIKEMTRWARKRWPSCAHHVLIENAGYGVELIVDLKREITGVTKVSPGIEGNKVSRAESASDALESGNCFLPGYGPPWQPAYDEKRTPASVAGFIHNAAVFPNSKHDDDVDSFSQAMNWLRSRSMRPGRTLSPFKGRRRAAL
jgi:predicted phage terminase large subunit-like protein